MQVRNWLQGVDFKVGHIFHTKHSRSHETNIQMSKHQVVAADDHPIFLEGLKALFNRKDMASYELSDTSNNGTEVLEIVKKRKPSFLLLELSLMGIEGLDLLSELVALDQAPHAIILSRYNDSKLVKQAMKNGAKGYLLKQSPPSELLDALEQVRHGGKFYGRGILRNSSPYAPAANRSNIYTDRFLKKFQLTRREKEVLHLISQAKSSKKIAEELFISDQTVSVHRKNIMRKLGVNSTAQLIKAAIDNRLV